MAKYDVKFSCGHTETISLIGPVAERERKIKYFEEYGVCSECYKKQQEAEREKLNAENAQKASELGTKKKRSSSVSTQMRSMRSSIFYAPPAAPL